MHNLDQELDVPIAKRSIVTSQRSRRTVKSRNKGVKSNNGPDLSVETLQVRPVSEIKTASTPRRAFCCSGNKYEKNSEKYPKANEINALRKEIEVNKPKIILWGDSSDHVIHYPLQDDSSTPRISSRGRVINDIDEDFSIEEQPKAVSLISTTAGVMDFIGVPDSTSYIR